MPDSKREPAVDMESAVAAFKNWRTTRKKKCPIPEPLWEMAVNLSRRYPLNTICQTLGLNWGTLRKKIDQLSGNAQASVCESLSFVELKLKGDDLHSPFAHSRNCAVELMRPDGVVMKIFASSDTPLNLSELCKTFLEKSKNRQ